MKLTQKLIIGFLAVSIFSAIVGYVGFASMMIVSDAVESMSLQMAPHQATAINELSRVIKTAIDRSLVSIILIIAVSMISAITLGVIYARAITRPVQDIKQASEEMKSGYSGVKKLSVVSEDEFGDLESTFNTMIDDVKKRDDEILKKNKELEKSESELQKKVAELERFNKLAVGRELKMIELKKKIKELEGKRN